MYQGIFCQGGVVGHPRGLWIPRPGFESRPWPPFIFPVLHLHYRFVIGESHRGHLNA